MDFEAGEIRLDPGTTKNGEGRVFDRYDIVSGDDLRQAALRLDAAAQLNTARVERAN